MAEGWIKLHRKISDNPLWTSEPFTKGQAWVDLILLANYKRSFFFKRGIKIEVDVGQCAWSELALSKRWKWSRNKVRKFLKVIEKEQQIEQQKNNVTQIVTILNYKEYQEKGTPKGTPKGHQKDTSKEFIKNRKEIYMREFEKSKNTKYKEFVDYLFGKNMLERPLHGVLSIEQQLTEEQFVKVMDRCNEKNKKIGHILTKIENDPKYYKGKKSLYRTLLNWIEDRFV